MEQNLCWLPIVFHFGTENWEEQLKKAPCMLRTPGANPQAAVQAVEEVDVGQFSLLPSLQLCFALWSQFDAFVFLWL